MATILGLNINNGDTSAAIIKDGKIVAAVDEERFVRIKSTWGFPKNSINYCLKRAGISIRDIDYFAIPTKSFVIKRFGKLYEKCLSGLKDLPNEKIRPYPHHLCHAAATFYCSGFEKSDILIMDNTGDDECISYFKGDGNKIELIWKIRISDVVVHENNNIKEHAYLSPGEEYYLVTKRLNFGEYGEGKTMAYSAFGREDKRIKKILWFDENFKLHTDASWENLFLKDENLRKNLAFRVQKDLSRLVHNILERIPNKTGFLCLGGGCFLNCSINREISKRPDIKQVFIQPNAKDSGNSLGAALCCYFLNNDAKHIEFNNAFLGPKFSDNHIEEEIKKFNLKYEGIKDPSKKAAELIHNDYIIGWFQGRMEWGPRALGNRSILANANKIEIKDRLNLIKGRGDWRPFGLSITDSDFRKHFRGHPPNKYMIVAYDVKGNLKDLVKGAVHNDNTTRIQVVDKKDNKSFWDLLSYYKKLSGIGAVINTSFNPRGAPIVCTPRDAIISFLRMDLDYLIIGNYLVFKEKRNPAKNEIDEVMIEITNRCPLDCPCCSFEDKTKVKKRDMNLQEFKKIIKYIKNINKAGCPVINFCGLGEPIFNEYFKDMLFLLKREGIRYVLSTNALFMNEKIIDILLKTGVKEIKISLDGVDRESYQKYRIGGNFDRVIENIKCLTGRRRELKSNAIVTLQLLVMSHTEKDIPEFIEQGKTLGADIIKFKSIFINDKKYTGLLPKLSRKYSRYHKYPNLVKKTHACQWADKKLYINSDGIVMPCCFAEHQKEYVLGNVFKEDMTRILTKDKPKQLFSSIKKGINSIALCKNCHQAALGITSKDIALSRKISIPNKSKDIWNYDAYEDNPLLVENRNEFHNLKKGETKLPFYANIGHNMDGFPLCLLQGYEEHLQIPYSLEFNHICTKGKLQELLAGKIKHKDCVRCKYHFVCFGISSEIMEKFRLRNIQTPSSMIEFML